MGGRQMDGFLAGQADTDAGLGTGGHQRLHHRQTAGLGSAVERGLTEIVHGLDGGAGLEQELDQFDVATHRRQVQWRAPVGIRFADGGSLGEQGGRLF